MAKQKTCKCPAYPFPHRMGGGKCGLDCQHPEVEIVYHLSVRQTLEMPAEYIGVSICLQCGDSMDEGDIPEWSIIHVR